MYSKGENRVQQKQGHKTGYQGPSISLLKCLLQAPFESNFQFPLFLLPSSQFYVCPQNLDVQFLF